MAFILPEVFFFGCYLWPLFYQKFFFRLLSMAFILPEVFFVYNLWPLFYQSFFVCLLSMAFILPEVFFRLLSMAFNLAEVFFCSNIPSNWRTFIYETSIIFLSLQTTKLKTTQKKKEWKKGKKKKQVNHNFRCRWPFFNNAIHCLLKRHRQLAPRRKQEVTLLTDECRIRAIDSFCLVLIKRFCTEK